MDVEEKDTLIALIATTITVGGMWFIGIFDIFTIFGPPWIGHAAAIVVFLIGLGYSKSIMEFSSANQEIAYNKNVQTDDSKSNEEETENNAIDKLKERFAKGEISAEEYKEKLEVLKEDER